jgi:hypothetical protein
MMSSEFTAAFYAGTTSEHRDQVWYSAAPARISPGEVARGGFMETEVKRGILL